MIFGDVTDSHDKRVQKILDRWDDDESFTKILNETTEAQQAPMVTNFNLTGIRRRLNNIEAGVWILVLLAMLHVGRHW